VTVSPFSDNKPGTDNLFTCLSYLPQFLPFLSTYEDEEEDWYDEGPGEEWGAFPPAVERRSLMQQQVEGWEGGGPAAGNDGAQQLLRGTSLQGRERQVRGGQQHR
jgi:hypothetical protein